VFLIFFSQVIPEIYFKKIDNIYVLIFPVTKTDNVNNREQLYHKTIMDDCVKNRHAITLIFEYLNDLDKLALLRVNKTMRSLFSKLVVFKEYYEFDKITELSYRDNFESICFVFDAKKDWSQILPNKVKNVIIEIYENCTIERLPQNIVSLIIDIVNVNYVRLVIPPRVEYLEAEGDVKIIGSPCGINSSFIPNSVTTLVVFLSFLNNHVIPNTVKTLHLYDFDEETKKIIPKSIVELILKNCDDEEFDCGNIPDHIAIVHFEGVFNVPLVGIPSKNLHNLYFGKNFNATFLNCVTESIEFISFGPYDVESKVFEQIKQINIDGFDKEICFPSRINSNAPYFVRFYKTNLGDGMVWC
jgi:hypothetical protein